MKTPLRTFVAVAVVSAVTFFAVAPASSDQVDTIPDASLIGDTTCPLHAGTGPTGYVIPMPEQVVQAGESYVYSLPTPVSGDLVNGDPSEYLISLRTYDGYADRDDDGFSGGERVILDFLYADDTVASSSVATQTLFGGDYSNRFFDWRGVLSATQNVTKIRVRHALATGDEFTGLRVVCVALTWKQDSAPTTTTTTTTTSTTTTSTTSSTSTTSTSSTTTVPDSTTTTVPDSTTTTSTSTSTTSTSSTTTVPDSTTTTTTTSTTTTVPDSTTTTSTSTSTTTVPDSTTTTSTSTSTTTTVPDSTTTSTVPDTTTTTSTSTSTTTTVPDSTTTTTTTTASPTTTTTTTTVPTQVLPEVEEADPADPVDGTPSFTG